MIVTTWDDTRDGTNKIIDTNIKYNNKYTDMELTIHIYNNGTVTLQGRSHILKKWHDTHYPYMMEDKNIVNVTIFPDATGTQMNEQQFDAQI